ncbi:MAG: hypothetical protein LBG44_10360 [Gemmatimonadota bacterium]|nr:hypothetical protein [Gemmatimonadota bacterium]
MFCLPVLYIAVRAAGIGQLRAAETATSISSSAESIRLSWAAQAAHFEEAATQGRGGALESRQALIQLGL